MTMESLNGPFGSTVIAFMVLVIGAVLMGLQDKPKPKQRKKNDSHDS